MRNLIAAALAAGALFSISPASAEVMHYAVKLDGASETPPNASKGVGLADVTLDTDLRVLSWKVTYSGLSGPATMTHFHGPAAPGAAAGVQVAFSGAMACPLVGTAPVNDGQIGDIRAGLWYINIHTAANPKGEIRGQVAKAH